MHKGLFSSFSPFLLFRVKQMKQVKWFESAESHIRCIQTIKRLLLLQDPSVDPGLERPPLCTLSSDYEQLTGLLADLLHAQANI